MVTSGCHCGRSAPQRSNGSGRGCRPSNGIQCGHVKRRDAICEQRRLARFLKHQSSGPTIVPPATNLSVRCNNLQNRQTISLPSNGCDLLRGPQDRPHVSQCSVHAVRANVLFLNLTVNRLTGPEDGHHRRHQKRGQCDRHDRFKQRNTPTTGAGGRKAGVPSAQRCRTAFRGPQLC